MAEEKKRKLVRKEIHIHLIATLDAPEGPVHGEQIVTLARGPIITNITKRAPQLDWNLQSLDMMVESEEVVDDNPKD